MALDPARIRALCFDVDGTLSDTDDLWISRMEIMLRPVSRLFPGGKARPFCRAALLGLETPGNFFYYLLDRFDLDDDAMRVYEAVSRARFLQARPRHFWLIERTLETLQALCPRYPMSVVSARDHSGTHAFLDHFALRPFFKEIVSSQTCRHTKPFADPVIHAAEKMGVRPEECLMIGDTVVDIRAGKSAGAQTVGVLCGFGQENELRRAGADLIVNCPADLVELLIG